jgi:hypothetical protein
MFRNKEVLHIIIIREDFIQETKEIFAEVEAYKLLAEEEEGR